MRKRLLCFFILSLLIGVIFTGCGDDGNTPASASTRFLEAVKAERLDDVEDIYFGDDLNPTAILLAEGALNSQGESIFNKKVLSFDYTLGSITEKDDIATVELMITSYNIGTLLSQLQSDQGFMEALMKKDTAAFSQEANTAFVNQIAQSKKTYEQTVKLHLTKIDKNWTVNTITPDSDFITAISGNTPETLDTMLASYKKLKAETENQNPDTNSAETDTDPSETSNTIKDNKIKNINQAAKAVADYLRIDDDDPQSPVIKVDSEDSVSYTVHCYEVMYNTDGTSYNASIGWFIVDKATGKVTEKE